MKKLAMMALAPCLFVGGVLAATGGFDNAANSAYSDGWTNLDNGGTAGTFLPWDLTNNNNGGSNFAGYFIGDSTAGSGDINTSGVSFGVYANPSTAFADAARSFGSALSIGQTFSLDLAVNFRNGNKGFSLFDGTTQIFNLNIGGDDYQINGVSIGAAYSPTAMFHLSLSQTSVGAGSYSVLYNSNTYTGSYTGIASGFKFYNSGTDDGSAANNLYFNNLSIVPEPSIYALLAGPALLGAWLFIRRRRVA